MEHPVALPSLGVPPSIPFLILPVIPPNSPRRWGRQVSSGGRWELAQRGAENDLKAVCAAFADAQAAFSQPILLGSAPREAAEPVEGGAGAEEAAGSSGSGNAGDVLPRAPQETTNVVRPPPFVGSVRLSVYVYVRIHTYIHVYIRLYTYIYVHICIHMYTYIYIYIYVYMCIYVYICVYTYTDSCGINGYLVPRSSGRPRPPERHRKF